MKKRQLQTGKIIRDHELMKWAQPVKQRKL